MLSYTDLHFYVGLKQLSKADSRFCGTYTFRRLETLEKQLQSQNLLQLNEVESL